MPFIHLSDGSVEVLTDTQWADAQIKSGTPTAYRKDGLEYQVIGVYADAVEHPLSAEEQTEIDAKVASDKAEFAAWRATQTATDGTPL